METVLVSGIIGVMVGIILLLIEYRTRWFARSMKVPQSEIISSNRDNVDSHSQGEEESHPFPEEIKDQIVNLPPFQRESAQKSYIGLRVRWKIFFHSILSKKGTKIVVMLNHSDRLLGPSIVCTLDTAEYPELKVAAAGRRARVSGKISQVDSLSIDLSDAVIEFDQ